MRSHWICAVMLLLCCVASLRAAWTADDRDAPRKITRYAATITGDLALENEHPVLHVKDKTYKLVTDDEEIRETLADDRISGRPLQVDGSWKSPDTFQVQRFFVVRDGKLLKLIYYCDVCNITT